MKYEHEIMHVETVYDGFLQMKKYRLRHSLFAGGMSPVLNRERVESFQAASVLLYDPLRDQVALVEQFRIGAIESPKGAWVLETIGGILEGDETPVDVAVREVREEAGYEVADLIKICEFMVSPGFTTERITLFCGRVDASKMGGVHGIDDEGEDIRVVVLSADEAIDSLGDGRINSTSIIIAIQWLALNRARLRKLWG